MKDRQKLEKLLKKKAITDEVGGSIDSELLNYLLSKSTITASPDIIALLVAIIPREDIDPGMVNLLGKSSFIEANSSYLPGSVICNYGFLVFAQAGDGSSFCINMEDGEILLLSVGKVQLDHIQNYDPKKPERVALSAREISAAAGKRRWSSFDEFLDAWDKALYDDDEGW